MGKIISLDGGGENIFSSDLSATADYVLCGKTYVGNDTDDEQGVGNMANLSESPNTKLTSSDSTPVLIGDAGFWDTNADGKSRLLIRYNGTQGFIKPNTLVGVEKSILKDAVIKAFGIGSVSNFKTTLYSSKTLLCSWNKPTNSGMWSGIVIRAKQGSYPSSISDGTVITDGTADISVTKELGEGTWYIKYWNYVTVSNADGGRWYDDGHDFGTFKSYIVGGSKNITGSTTFVVPEGARKLTAFCVGGGGGTRNPELQSSQLAISGGAGGGYTKTASFAVTPGENLTINVGAGGNGSNNGSGGTSSIYRGSECLISAKGGENGGYVICRATTTNGLVKGGDGGSGGGGGIALGRTGQSMYDIYVSAYSCGGSDGNDSTPFEIVRYNFDRDVKSIMQNGKSYIGIGQHTSTKAWGNTGQPYAPGSNGIHLDQGEWTASVKKGETFSGDIKGNNLGGGGLTGANSGAAYFGGWAKEDGDTSAWKANSHGGNGSSGIVLIKWE